MKVNFNTVTAGDGYWSNVIGRRVRIFKLDLPYVNDRDDFGELTAYFNPDDWRCQEDGLIYTDSLWMKMFKFELANFGFSEEAIKQVSYSEQGMQGDNYVSMDVNREFIREYRAILAQLSVDS